MKAMVELDAIDHESDAEMDEGGVRQLVGSNLLFLDSGVCLRAPLVPFIRALLIPLIKASESERSVSKASGRTLVGETLIIECSERESLNLIKGAKPLLG